MSLRIFPAFRTGFAALAVYALCAACGEANAGSRIHAACRGRQLVLDVTLPAKLFLAALPGNPRDILARAGSGKRLIRSYFDAHVAVYAENGAPQAFQVDSAGMIFTRRGGGRERALRVTLRAALDSTPDPNGYSLWFDAVIHHAPAHRVELMIGKTGAGVFHFDSVEQRVNPLSLSGCAGTE